MSAPRTAPGIQFETNDFSDYSPSLASTSFGVVGTAIKGPLFEATFVSSVEDFILKFGEPAGHGAHAAVNFLRKGNQLYFVRVAKEFDKSTTLAEDVVLVDGLFNEITVGVGHGIAVDDFVEISEPGLTTFRAQVAAVDVNTITFPVLSAGRSAFTAASAGATAASNASVRFSKALIGAGAAETFGVSRWSSTVAPLLHIRAKSVGSWSNFATQRGIEVQIEDGGSFANLDPVTNLPVYSDTGFPLEGIGASHPSVDEISDLYALTSATVRAQDTVGVNTVRSVFSVTSVGLGTDPANMDITLPGISTADFFAVGNSITLRGSGFDVVAAEILSVAVVAEATVLTVANPTAPTVLTTLEGGTVENLDTEASQALVFRCVSSSATGSTWSMSGVLTKKLSVYYKGRLVESFENLVGYNPNLPNYWNAAITSDYIEVEYLGAGNQPINSRSAAHLDNPRYLMGLTMSVRQSDDSEAAFTTVHTIAGIDGGNAADAEYVRGLQPFRRKETYQIDLIAVPGVSTPATLREALVIAEARDDSFALIDPPDNLSPQEVVEWHNGRGDQGNDNAFTSSFGGVFYPWVRQYDPYGRQQIWVPPSAVVAPQIAFSDQQSEVWFAPAGLTRGTIQSASAVRYQLEDGDVELMHGPANGNAVNSIRQFAKDGIVVFSQRTLQRYPSALDRINVRRLVSFIIKTLRSSVRRLSFEQNDEILWSQARGVITPVLTNLQGRRALEWFSVIADTTNNTPLRRNQNQMRVDVQIIPVKSAEVVTIGLNLFPSGVTVEDIRSVVASL